MRIVLSFDDGRKDAFRAYKILKKYSLVGTFHITTGFVDGSFQTDSFGEGRDHLSIDEIKQMHNDGMEISSHGDKHVMNKEDFMLSKNKLSNWGVIHKQVGFSVPNSDYDENSLNDFVTQNKESLSYVRVGRSRKCYTLLSKIHYVLYNLFHIQFFYNNFNKHNLIKNINKYRIESVVVKRTTKSKSIKKFILRYNNEEYLLVLMFHSIVDHPKNKWEYSAKEFESLCDFLSKNASVVILDDVVKCRKENDQ